MKRYGHSLNADYSALSAVVLILRNVTDIPFKKNRSVLSDVLLAP